MKKLLLAATVLGALASPTYAGFVLTPDQVGQSGVVNYSNGIVGGQQIPGLTAAITFTLTGVNLTENIWSFGFSVDNTSSGAITDSRISTWGFNTNPDFGSATLTNVTDASVFKSLADGNVPQLPVDVEFCASAKANAQNCSGGGGTGVLPGDSPATGSFNLDFSGFATPLTQITFSDLYVRYQSIAGTTFGDSGIGSPGPGVTPFCDATPCSSVPVPGPAVGAGLPGLVAALFGLLGFNHWRRRRLTA